MVCVCQLIWSEKAFGRCLPAAYPLLLCGHLSELAANTNVDNCYRAMDDTHPIRLRLGMPDRRLVIGLSLIP